MARTKRWQEGNLERGAIEVTLSSWKYFSDYINQEMLDYTNYIYRGHGDSLWKLEPTIDRVIKFPKSKRRETLLESFKLEIRGRRGRNPPPLETEYDYWALGQHHGLHTPLLDWTESPFVSLFFAAEKALEIKSKKLSVFALSQNCVEKRNKNIREDDAIKPINGRKPTVRIFKSNSDENNRLVSQRGLFTRGPNNMDLEAWIKAFEGTVGAMELIKITMPNKDISDCLRYLNRMNINNSTLFPDLSGASEYCNKKLKIQKY